MQIRGKKEKCEKLLKENERTHCGHSRIASIISPCTYMYIFKIHCSIYNTGNLENQKYFNSVRMFLYILKRFLWILS